ncbi:MAG: hypothetical protein ACI96P_002538 [Candidatus Azotimanducaceae bacterium]|jgi:hypothetical protein
MKVNQLIEGQRTHPYRVHRLGQPLAMTRLKSKSLLKGAVDTVAHGRLGGRLGGQPRVSETRDLVSGGVLRQANMQEDH